MLLLPSAPASAHTTCRLGGDKTATSTTAYANDCTSAQARIDRYLGGGAPYSYVSGWGSSPTVSSSAGSNSGNYVRANLHGTIGPWNLL